MIQFIEREIAGAFHEEVDGFHFPMVSLSQGWREAGRDTENTEQKEDADGSVISLQLLGEKLLRDEA